MQIFVDADACPVVAIVEKIAKEHNVPVTLLCDTNHVLSSAYSEVVIVGAGTDAVDYKLISICHKGDIVVSQDYGVAAMALGKGAYAIHQSGKWYTFLFVDCLYVTIRKDYETKNYAIYVILGYDVDGQKDILGLWLSESESKHQWMQIFDEIKSRGVEDVLFISMDGVSGLEEGAKAIFPNVTVQRCIVHLIRNSIKYVPNKDYKKFTAQLKKVYGAASLKAAEAEFERFKQTWSQYPGAIDVWVRNWQHVAQLYDYGSAVRKILYTTNAVESVNSSLRKVTKKGAFPNENALFKLLYLRITELYKKWNGRPLNNWALVRNQLDMDEKIQERIRKYENGGL